MQQREATDRNRAPKPQIVSARCSRGLAALPVLSLVLVLASVSPTIRCAGATTLTGLPSGWVDDRGKAFDLNAVRGRAVVLTMAYATCHRVCPISMRRLQELQRDFDRRGTSAEFLIIGYDPDSDDAVAWHQYRQSRHLTRSNWHFLVGTRASVEQTARQLGFDFWKYDQHVMHALRILVFDEQGTLIDTETAELESAKR